MSLLSENECYKTLRQIDIQVAINYYGVTELLDAMGVATIEDYLLMCQVDETYSEFHTPPEPTK